jgi:thiol-disulfide isomerase/thioredoxin
MVDMPGKIRIAIIAAAVLVGIAGCSGTGQTGQSVAGSSGFQSGNHQFHYWSVGQRKTVGNVTGTTVAGTSLDLASYRGKYVVVNFWSEHCVPCHGEEPYFESLAKSEASHGVQFVGIDERDNLADARTFEQQYGVTYPSLFDQHDNYILDFPGAVPSTTPFTIIIDPDGGIAARATDSMDYTTLRAFISRVRSMSA